MKNATVTKPAAAKPATVVVEAAPKRQARPFLPPTVQAKARKLLDELLALRLSDYQIERKGLCACGCGSTTGKAFAPGHDRRFEGFATHALFGSSGTLALLLADEIPSGGLPSKSDDDEPKAAAPKSDVKPAAKPEVKPAPAVVVEKPKAGPGSGGLPKVKAVSAPSKKGGK